MKRIFESETDLLSEFFGRLKQRMSDEQSVTRKLTHLKAVAHSSDKHFERLVLARKRLARACAAGDRNSIEYEEQVILALLYEIADTIYMVSGLLELKDLQLGPSADGQGIVGEHAAELTHILDTMNRTAAKLLQLEQELSLKLDFSRPVDEKEGITFETHPHWQGFSSLSFVESFDAYFLRAQQLVAARLNEKIPFLHNRTVREQLVRKGRKELVEILARLENAPLGGLHIEKTRMGRETSPPVFHARRLSLFSGHRQHR